MGRLWKIPLALELTKQLFCYYKRLQKLEIEGSDSLGRHAYSEQRYLKLAWYNKLTELRQTIQDRENNHVNYSSQIRKSLRTTFCEIWEAERKTNRKLGFYNSIKETFSCETYLNIGLSYQEQKRLAQFRTSSHRDKAETGRYKQKYESVSVVNRICEYCSPNSEIWEAERKTNRKLGFYNSIKETFSCETYLNIGLSYQEQKRLAQFRTSSHRDKADTGRYESVSVVNRICEYCSTNSEVIVNFSALPFFEPIIEDEKHVLFECPQHNIAEMKKFMENRSRNKKPSRRKQKTSMKNG